MNELNKEQLKTTIISLCEINHQLKMKNDELEEKNKSLQSKVEIYSAKNDNDDYDTDNPLFNHIEDIPT